MQFEEALRGATETLHTPVEGHQTLLLELLAKLDDETALRYLSHLCDATALRQEAFENLLVAFLAVEDLARWLGYDRTVSLYQLAGETGQNYLQSLLLRGRLEMNQLLPLPEEEPPRISIGLEAFTLGERRAFAKGVQQRKLQMLVYDNDPIVIANLLSNPRVFEKEVLKIASRRPQSRAVLAKIFAHRRWSGNYGVRKALAFNPHTPRYLAAGLINFVHPTDLKYVVEMRADFPEVVAIRAELLLKQRPA